MAKLPKEFIEQCKSVTAKRPKTVIDHILEHGFVTTEQLKNVYGYDHPPRAVRDVREHGIPVETYRVVGANGRKIAAYRFGGNQVKRLRKFSGRTGLSKKLKDALLEKYGCKCAIYLEVMPVGELQIDHRVPYEVAGDDAEGDLNPDDFMLLSGSANRAKSWSCEHCENWNNAKDRSVCLSCYWAFPDKYAHVAMRQIRRLDLIWQGEEIEIYEKLKVESLALEKETPSLVKELIEREVRKKRT